MESISIERLIQDAEQQFRYGDYNGAIESLKEALSFAPDYGFLHSYLSFGLIKQKRLGAAFHEAQLGLELEPNSSYTHFAIGNVLLAKRKYRVALEHLNSAIALDPDNEAYLLAQSRCLQKLGNKKEAELTLIRALEMAPDDPDVLAEYGDFQVSINQYDKASQFYQQALELEPQHLESLIGKGNVLLKAGMIQDAREHAVWALQQDPNDASALHLLTSIKARSNPVMGLWWRLNSWLVSGNNARTITLLIVGFLFFRLSSIILSDAGYQELGSAVSFLWLGIVVYTWVGPSWFNKKLKAELETVTLNKSF